MFEEEVKEILKTLLYPEYGDAPPKEDLKDAIEEITTLHNKYSKEEGLKTALSCLPKQEKIPPFQVNVNSPEDLIKDQEHHLALGKSIAIHQAEQEIKEGFK